MNIDLSSTVDKKQNEEADFQVEELSD